MKNLECIIFNVEHGFASFIKSPNNYGLMIDCGGSATFSPIKWIRSEYNAGKQNITYFGTRRIAELKITHLHKDHFEDVGSFAIHQEDKPKQLLADKKTFKFIDEKIKQSKDEDANIKVLKEFKKFRESYSEDVKEKVDWGFDAFESCQLTYEEANELSKQENNLVNNRSFVFAVKYAGIKILFPGDLEVEAWDKILQKSSSKSVLSDTNIFIAAHHGHKTGFTQAILDKTGIPDIFVVSAKCGDECVDCSYSKEQNSKGRDVYDGSKILKSRRMISTREFGKSFKITINENGTYKIETIETSDNLTKHQKNLIVKETIKMTRNLRN